MLTNELACPFFFFFFFYAPPLVVIAAETFPYQYPPFLGCATGKQKMDLSKDKIVFPCILKRTSK